MNAHTPNTAHAARRAIRWLLVWPVLCAVVVFASLNPVACLIHCAAQAEQRSDAARPADALLCFTTEVRFSLGQSTTDDPLPSVPRAVHELVLGSGLVIVAALVLLYALCGARVRPPCALLLPPNPPPKFG
jgi:hypothetical protein